MLDGLKRLKEQIFVELKRAFHQGEFGRYERIDPGKKYLTNSLSSTFGILTGLRPGLMCAGLTGRFGLTWIGGLSSLVLVEKAPMQDFCLIITLFWGAAPPAPVDSAAGITSLADCMLTLDKLSSSGWGLTPMSKSCEYSFVLTTQLRSVVLVSDDW